MTGDQHLLIGAYATDALDEPERDVFEDHLADCPTCAAELPGLLATAATLGAAAQADPPARLKQDVLARLDSVRQLPPLVQPVQQLSLRRERRSMRMLVSVAAALVVLAAVGATWSTLRYRDVERQQQQIAVAQQTVARVLAAPDSTTLKPLPTEAAWSGARVVMSPSLGEAVLVADGLAKPPHGHTYELWVIDETSPKPAGTFEPGDSAALSRVVEGSMAGAKAVAVTVEPDGGSPTPSGDPVATFAVPTA